jgi:hypothetical protein
MPIHDDLDDRGSESDYIERCHRDFANTGDPLYAWEAFARIRFIHRRRLNQDFPDSFTRLPKRLSRRDKPSAEHPRSRFFQRSPRDRKRGF